MGGGPDEGAQHSQQQQQTRKLRQQEGRRSEESKSRAVCELTNNRGSHLKGPVQETMAWCGKIARYA